MYYCRPILLSIFILFAGSTAFAQEHQHNDHLSTLLEHYLSAKDALNKDDYGAARGALSEFRKEVVGNKEMHNHKEHPKKHVQHHRAMVEAVDKAAKAGDIDELRSAFKDISDQLTAALENQGYDDKVLYLHYCPMAVNNQGAQWISERKTINNPYMGQKMSGCGTTKREINPKN